jgi:hypothetical protein
MTPRELPRSTRDHVIIVGADSNALSIALRCRHYDIPYAMLVSDSALALGLFDKRFNVVLGGSGRNPQL